MFSHEIRRISKDQLPGMVSPMFNILTIRGTIRKRVAEARKNMTDLERASLLKLEPCTVCTPLSEKMTVNIITQRPVGKRCTLPLESKTEVPAAPLNVPWFTELVFLIRYGTAVIRDCAQNIFSLSLRHARRGDLKRNIKCC